MISPLIILQTRILLPEFTVKSGFYLTQIWLQSRLVDLLCMKWVRAKDLQITLMVCLELIQVSMLSHASDLVAVGIILIVKVIGLYVQVLETFLD